MRQDVRTLPLLFMLAIMLPACFLFAPAVPAIDTEALADNLPAILDRHDAYAPVLPAGTEREEALAESKAVRDAFDANRDGFMPAGLGPYLYPVLERHDAWVRADTTLSTIAQTIYLDSSKAVLLLFQASEETASASGAAGGG